jgi:hypothetical protein
MEMSSRIKRPRKPIESRITPPTIAVDKVAGATGSMALNTTSAVMPSGGPAGGRKAAKSVTSNVGDEGAHRRGLARAEHEGQARSR